MKITKIGKVTPGYVDGVHTRRDKIDKDNLMKNKKIDKIEISDTSKSLLNKIKNAEDGKYSEKVERIRKEILNNSYEISSKEIAEKLLEVISTQEGLE